MDMTPDTSEVSRVALLADVGQAKPKPTAAALRPRYLPIDDACRYAGIGRSKLYKDYLKRLRTLRVGRRHLVELASLDELLDEMASMQKAEGAPS